MRVRSALFAMAAGAAALGLWPAGAVANPVNCLVNASGGSVNCLSFANPSTETVKANPAAGLPYRFQLHRPSTSSTWGWWEYNDLDYHVVPLSLSGTIVAQVDNRGTANPASYWVAME